MIDTLKILSLANHIFCALLLCLVGTQTAFTQPSNTFTLGGCKPGTPTIQRFKCTPNTQLKPEEIPIGLRPYLKQEKYKVGSITLVLENPSEEAHAVVLSFDELDKVVLILQEANPQDIYETGFKTAHQSKNIDSPILNQHLILLHLKPKEKHYATIYFVSSLPLPSQLSIGLQCEEAWQENYHWHLWLQAFFLGVLSLFVLILLFIYLNNGFKVYLYLFAYCFLIEISSLSNFNYFLGLTSYATQDYLLWALTSQLAAIFLIEFIRKALDVILYSAFFDNLLKLLILTRILSSLAAVYVFATESSVYLTSIAIALADISNIIFAFWILIYYSIYGNAFARYLATSTILLVVGLIFNIAYNHGYAQESLEIPYFFQAGVVGQIFVICLGLGVQLKGSINNQRKAQAKVLVLQKEINTRLELKVKERTEALEKASREIQLRNDELNQQQEEILSINNHLEGLVEVRTLEIKKQNELLRNYAYFNAHKVRGPLARILGLIYLIKIETPQKQEDFLDFIQRLEVCANELDLTIREINEILSDDEIQEDG